MGRTDIEDALQRLDKLTQEEARMATAEGLKLTHGIDNKVEGVDNKLRNVYVRVKDVGYQIAGARITFIQSSTPHRMLYMIRRRENQSADRKRC